MLRIRFMEFMKWAFAEELVHLASNNESAAWSRMASYAALGTVIDRCGHGTSGLPDIDDVHPDAVAASEAVMLLSAETFDLPEGWNPMPEFDDPHGLIAETVATVLKQRASRDRETNTNNLIATVIGYAVMQREPEWRVATPHFRMVMRRGKPAWFRRETFKDSLGQIHSVEMDGYNAKLDRPKPGAYRKFELSEPIEGAVRSRIDWYLWAKAVTTISNRLQTGLVAHRVERFEPHPEIWTVVPVAEVIDNA